MLFKDTFLGWLATYKCIFKYLMTIQVMFKAHNKNIHTGFQAAN